jgi:hypothetical protein
MSAFRKLFPRARGSDEKYSKEAKSGVVFFFEKPNILYFVNQIICSRQSKNNRTTTRIRVRI